jgi:hypothetical protein
MSDRRKKPDECRRHRGDQDNARRERGGDVFVPVAAEGDALHARGVTGWT